MQLQQSSIAVRGALIFSHTHLIIVCTDIYMIPWEVILSLAWMNEWIASPLLSCKHRNQWWRSLINDYALVNNASVCCCWLPWWQHHQHLCSDRDDLWRTRCWNAFTAELFFFFLVDDDQMMKMLFLSSFQSSERMISAAGPGAEIHRLHRAARDLMRVVTCGCVLLPSGEQSISCTVDRHGGGETGFLSWSGEAVGRVRHGWAHHQARHVGNRHGVAWKRTRSRERERLRGYQLSQHRWVCVCVREKADQSISMLTLLRPTRSTRSISHGTYLQVNNWDFSSEWITATSSHFISLVVGWIIE